jgi:hypothetical protein
MFRRFFAALASLAANAEALAQSFAEANSRFRTNLALDHADQPEQLEHEPAAAKSKKVR